MSFIKAVRTTFMKGVPILFEELCDAILCKSGMIVGNATIKLRPLHSMRMSFWVVQAKWWLLNTKVYVIMVTIKGNSVKAIIRRAWVTEISTGLPITASLEIGRQLKLYLIGERGKSLCLVNRKSDLKSYNRVTNSEDWGSSQTQSHLNERKAGSP